MAGNGSDQSVTHSDFKATELMVMQGYVRVSHFPALTCKQMREQGHSAHFEVPSSVPTFKRSPTSPAHRPFRQRHTRKAISMLYGCAVLPG